MKLLALCPQSEGKWFSAGICRITFLGVPQLDRALGVDAHVRVQAHVAAAARLPLDPGHECGAHALLLSGVVDVEAVDLARG